ncbi:DUF4333 domain-containing protein [Antrihabitans cavernicola]|uniref:DUF4333 domain-containing protein n=1 Tax=Antrihabitans cavernicola TaxID=2495913 RepID=A0A5A7S7X1_9NOCA|nr:DUF4333 domain-containing protein [Spelaeibacter cavernicola]KAA0021299.1 DUF4333 domain-containing protein [Spelaeibacter cavernicola]
MSGPYGPTNPDDQWAGPGKDSAGATPSGPVEDNADDVTKVFNNPPQPSQPQAPYQAPQPQQPQPQQQSPQGQWGQAPQQPNQQWGQQAPAQQQWGQQAPPQGQWGQAPQQPNQQWGQQAPAQQQWGQQAPPQGQWGQAPQQPNQQWGQSPQQPNQQWGQQPDPFAQAKPQKKSKLPLFIGAGVLALIAIAVVLFFVLGSKDTLDQNAAQEGVQKVLTDSYGAEDVTDVSCPADQEVKKDATFDCTVKVGGDEKKVTVKFTDDSGTYEVGRPN